MRNAAARLYGSQAFATLLLLAVPVSSNACLPRFERVVTSDPHHFGRAMIDALGWAHQGLTRVSQAPADAEHVALIFQLKRQAADYNCAAQELKPFVSSSDQFIAPAAKMTLALYEELAQSTEQMLGEITGALDAVGRGEDIGLGRLTARVASLENHRNDMGKLLAATTGTSLYALVAYGDQGQATGRFRLTRRQRVELIQELERVFGDEVRRGLRPGQLWSVGAGGLMHGFLVDPKWRATDD